MKIAKDIKLSVIGLGKLGTPTALCFASKGYKTIGFDANPETLSLLAQKKSLLNETGVGELLQSVGDNFEVVNTLTQAIHQTEVSFIIVPTPSGADGYFEIDRVLKVGEEIGRHLRMKNSFHLVVLVSTVMPGSTEKLKILLEKESGKKCGMDFGLCYNPEFIALGTVVENFLNPDLVLIGESDPYSGEVLSDIYSIVCENEPNIQRMNWVNAEITKLSINTFITTKIAFANTLTQLCHQFSGGNVDAVTAAMGADTRIGAKYLKGGMGYGGPCFPRDTIAFSRLAERMEVSSSIATATQKMNDEHLCWLEKLALSHLKESESVGILGLSYKTGTPVTEGSQSQLLAERLLKRGICVNVFDPLVKATRKAIKYFHSLEECFQNSSVIIIANPDVLFLQIAFDAILMQSRKKVVIDPWRLYGKKQLPESWTYISLGLASATSG